MDVAEVAKRAGAKSVVLSHMIPMLDPPGVMEKLLAEMRTVYDGDIIVGRDLMQVPLKVRHPGRVD
jgi:ribonuclease BN (tRNA processing enzyme)